MKKLMTTLLAVLMVFGCAVTSVAAEDTADSTKTTEVAYEVAQTYEWDVPAKQTFTAISDTLSDGKVTVSNAVIKEGNEVKITVASENYSSGWRMKRGSDNYYMTYSMKKGDAEVSNNGVVLEVVASTTAGAKASGEQALTFAITDSDKAGTFSDTLTFSATIAAVAA